MEWPLILALALLVPCVLMPAYFLWYLNRGGVVVSIKFARTKPAAPEAEPVTAGRGEDPEATQYEQVLLKDLKRYLKDNRPALE